MDLEISTDENRKKTLKFGEREREKK